MAASRTLEQGRVERALGRRSRPLLVWLVLFAVYAAGAGLHATPGSDLRPSEAHVLLSAHSLVHDGDFELRNEYEQAAWSSFYRGQLTPSSLIAGGRLIEPQGFGFPLLVAPAYAIGGRIAVELWLAALAALGFAIAAGVARRVVPEPWATRGVIAVGLSPPAVLAATTIAPGALAGTLLAGSLALALRVRDDDGGGRSGIGSAALLAMIPWLAPLALLPGVMIAVSLYHWIRRRRRGWSAFAALETVLLSGILYTTINRRIFGGFTPWAASVSDNAPTGIARPDDLLDRVPRLLGVWLDPHVGLLLYAPVAGLCFAAGWHAWRLRRERIVRAFPGEDDAMTVTAVLVMTIAAGALTTLLLPSFNTLEPGAALVPVLALLAALGSAGLRRYARPGAALALIGLVLTAWTLVAARADTHAGVSPPRGAVPWSALGTR